MDVDAAPTNETCVVCKEERRDCVGYDRPCDQSHPVCRECMNGYIENCIIKIDTSSHQAWVSCPGFDTDADKLCSNTIDCRLLIGYRHTYDRLVAKVALGGGAGGVRLPTPATVMQLFTPEQILHFIDNNVLPATCPKCGTHYDDTFFDGCNVLQCGNKECHASFCGVCMWTTGDANNNDDALHEHINTVHGALFARETIECTSIVRRAYSVLNVYAIARDLGVPGIEECLTPLLDRLSLFHITDESKVKIRSLLEQSTIMTEEGKINIDRCRDLATTSTFLNIEQMFMQEMNKIQAWGAQKRQVDGQTALSRLQASVMVYAGFVGFYYRGVYRDASPMVARSFILDVITDSSERMVLGQIFEPNLRHPPIWKTMLLSSITMGVSYGTEYLLQRYTSLSRNASYTAATAASILFDRLPITTRLHRAILAI
eukprot:GILJ01022637.1.p1 GENE.GILJ01022637.1~~GILJ01022637.1.p1  ORF type:complete len:430 (+),score=21.21 GILJ01022637.1:827-2116(+)